MRESEKQGAHGLALLRQDEIGPDIREWPEDEFALCDARMRKPQVGVLDLQIAEIEQIEIDRARNVSQMTGRPAEQLFNRRQLVQQFQRLARVAKFDRGIQEFSGALFAPDRFGFVNARGTHWRKRAAQRRDILPRVAQGRQPLPEIRPKRYCDSHLFE